MGSKQTGQGLMPGWKFDRKGRRATSDIVDTPRPGKGPEGIRLDDVLAAWISASPDGVVVLDSDLRIVYASPAFCALFGYTVDRLLGKDALTLVPERHRQTALTHWADVRDGRSKPLLGVVFRADGSELQAEMTATGLDLGGKRFLVFTVRDVTKRQRQVRQAVALAQAAATLAMSASIDEILEAVSECALAGTRALAAWVKLDDQDHVGAAGVPDGLREYLRSAPAAAACRLVYQEALAARRVVVYADWRQQMERALGTTCPLNLPWQPAAIARLLHRGVTIGMLTTIYREGDIP